MVSATSSSLSPKSAHTLSKSSMAEKTQRGGQEREKEEREWEREREKERGERETGEWKNEIRDRKRVKRAEESEQKEKEKERKRGGRERTDEQSERERERTESDTSKWVGRALLDPWHHLQNLALKRKTKHRGKRENKRLEHVYQTKT